MTRNNFGIGIILLMTSIWMAATAAWAQKSDATSRLKGVESDIEKLKSELNALTGNKSVEEAAARLDRMADDIRSLRQNAAQTAIEKDEAEAEAARLNAETERLAAEVAALKESLDGLKTEVNVLSKSPTAGYDHGFFIRSRDALFKLRMNGRVRPQYTLTLQRQYKTEENGDLLRGADGKAELSSTVASNEFDIESARLEMSVSMFERLTGVLSLDFGTLSGEVDYPVNGEVPDAVTAGNLRIEDRAVLFIDAFGEYRVVDAFVIRAGQFKVPFDLETAYDDGSLVFSSRSLMTKRYLVFADEPNIDEADPMYRAAYDITNGSSFGRDLGAMLGGTAFDHVFDYHLGVFNGGGLNRENDNRDVLVAARLAVSPFGPLNLDMSDLDGNESPRVSVGAGAAFDLPVHTSPALPEEMYNSLDINATLDAAVKWRGLCAFTSVYYRRSDHGYGLSRKSEILHSLGTTAQVAYYLSALHLEPAVRYSFFSARLDSSKDYVHEGTVGVNYHVFEEHLRVGIEYRGLFPVDKEASYLSPVGVRHEPQHEIGVSAEVEF